VPESLKDHLGSLDNIVSLEKTLAETNLCGMVALCLLLKAAHQEIQGHCQ